MVRLGLTFDDVLLEPRKTAVNRRDASVETRLTKQARLAIPLLGAASDTVSDARFAIALGKLGGMGVLHRNCTVEEQMKMVKEVRKAGVMVGAAVGPKDVERAVALSNAGAEVIFIDCAHAHAPGIIAAAKEMKKKMQGKLVAGNIVTKEAALDFAGIADAFKVGIGPGSICTTRIVSGVGVPQLTAIMDVVSVAKKRGIPVIADGGIRSSGDIVKALAAGASSVMLGSLFAGAQEAPGEIIVENGTKYKMYRGMGSKEAIEKRYALDRYDASHHSGSGTLPLAGAPTTPPRPNKFFRTKFARARGLGTPPRAGGDERQTHSVAEGVSGKVLYRGSLKNIVAELIGGVQSGMGYIGAATIEDIPKQARFIQITNAGLRESHTHSLR
jgi:IMP dehydrogenase